MVGMHLNYMKLRSEMDCFVSDVIWFKDSAQDFLREMFGNLLPKVHPSIRVLFRSSIRYRDVRVSDKPRYEPEYMEDDCWGGYYPTYEVELRVGPSDIMVFRIYHFYGSIEINYVDHVGNVYDSMMLQGELREFLEGIYEEVGKIHMDLYNQTKVYVDDIDYNLYENKV